MAVEKKGRAESMVLRPAKITVRKRKKTEAPDGVMPNRDYRVEVEESGYDKHNGLPYTGEKR